MAGVNVTLFTDASWGPTTRVGGWAIWYRREQVRFTASGCFEGLMAGSNLCEMGAIVKGVGYLCTNRVLQTGDTLIIVTDSLDAKHVIETGRTDHGLAVKEMVRTLGISLRINHVKAHMNQKLSPRNWVNGLVDRLSREARVKEERRLGLRPESKHDNAWKKEAWANPTVSVGAPRPSAALKPARLLEAPLPGLVEQFQFVPPELSP